MYNIFFSSYYSSFILLAYEQTMRNSCVFRPSHTNAHDASESVPAKASMASTKSSSVRVWGFHTPRFPGDYGLVRVFVLQRLDPGHLIYGYGMAACRTYCFRLMVDCAELIHFFRKSLRRICFLGGMKPVADEMGADLPKFFLPPFYAKSMQ